MAVNRRMLDALRWIQSERVYLFLAAALAMGWQKKHRSLHLAQSQYTTENAIEPTNLGRSLTQNEAPSVAPPPAQYKQLALPQFL